MKFEENYSDYRREEPWQISYEKEPKNIEYVFGEVFYRNSERVGWVDRTGFIEDNEQANFLITLLRNEFRGEYFEAGVKILSPEVNQRRFVKYMIITLDPLQRGRFEASLADFLGCTGDEVSDLALLS
jgi:hypothetical protein